MNKTTKKRPPTVSKIDLSGLSNFSFAQVVEGGLSLAGGRPLEIPLDEIVEDAEQARGADNPGFSDESLAELAGSIRESKGVRTPISVRSKNSEGKHVINHGARRYRASQLAGMKTINAFIDDTHDDYDQAAENIQREAFTPMEIALFVQKRERMGDERALIAKRLGKSKSFVTRHAALLELGPELRGLYDSGRTRDCLTLYNLWNLAKEHPEEVAGLVNSTAEITRSAVESLKASLQTNARHDRHAPPSAGSESESAALVSPMASGALALAAQGHSPNLSDGSQATRDRNAKGDEPQGQQERSTEAPGRRKGSVVMVSRKQSVFVLRVDLLPTALHMGWIEDPATGERSEVELADLRIDSIAIR